MMDRQDILAVLKKIDPFTALEADVLAEVCARASVHPFKTGTYIFKQKDPSLESLFVIVSGLVEIIVTSDRGIETIVGLRKPKDFFGETAALSSQRYTASTRVKQDLVCIKILRRDLENLIYNYPEFSSFFNELLAERMRVLYERIQADQNHDVTSFGGMPLFRKRVSEIMTPSVVTCRADDQAALAARMMANMGISSTIVLDDHGIPMGIVTLPSIVRNLILDCTCPVDNCTAEKIMDRSLEKISPHAFIGEALVALTRQKTKYLLVMDQDTLVGILTAIDLIKSRNLGHLTFLRDVEVQQTMDGLAGVSSEIDGVLNALLMEGAKVPDILEVMSGLHERLVRAVIAISENQMIQQGFGPPPVDYCWINMGSDARHEQTLRTDQDNAMIYADPEDKDLEQVDAYFKHLADIIVHGLDRCGFKLCTGNVMATHPKWRRSVSGWISYIDQWSRSLDPEDTLVMTILLDFRPVWGNQALARKLWDKIFDIFDDPEKMNHMLTREDLRFDIPINFLGNIRTVKTGPYKNQINLKTGALVHIINGARIFAVNSRITETSTLGRLQQLLARGVLSEKQVQFLKTAFETLVMFRIRTNLQKIRQNLEPDNYLDPSTLSSNEVMLLKDALHSASQMQKLMRNRFTQMAINFFS